MPSPLGNDKAETVRPHPDGRAAELANVIWTAWSEGRKLNQLPADIAPSDPLEGALAQEALASLAGEHTGWKIAATSAAGQRHIGVTTPIPGRLFSQFGYSPGASLSSSGMNMRVVEVEFAFRIGGEVQGRPPFGMDQVAEVVTGIHLAVELPDSRFADFTNLGPAVLLADNACAGRYVLGQHVGLLSEDEMRHTRTELLIDGEVAASGSGANVLDGPWSALIWLANAVPSYGWGLKGGDIVLTGTTTIPVPVMPGISVQAEFGALGSLSFRLSET